MENKKRPRPEGEEAGAGEVGGAPAQEHKHKMAKLAKLGECVQEWFSQLGRTVKIAPPEVAVQSAPSGAGKPPAKSKRDGLMAATALVGTRGSTESAVAEARAWGLDASLVANIEAAGLTRFFPVQREVIPLLLRARACDDPTVGDVCVSAPTGSGKTVVYVLPVLQAVLREGVPATLAALVLLPTRELAAQVAGVFRSYAAGTAVQVGLLSGAHSFAEEEAAITATAEGDARAAVHVLVATPGRLIDHLDRVPPLTGLLSQLRFLIVDEADRLLSESYSSWAHRLNEVLATATGNASTTLGRYTGAVDDMLPPVFAPVSVELVRSVSRPSISRLPAHGEQQVGAGRVQPLQVLAAASYTTAQTWLQAPAWLRPGARREERGGGRVAYPTPLPVPLRRIVCSATLTSNPQKLAALGLFRPLHFQSTADVAYSTTTTTRSSAAAAGEGGEGGVLGPLIPGASGAADTTGDDGKRVYSLPSTLHHVHTVVAAENKPIALLQLLRMLEGQGVKSSPPSGAGGAPTGLRAMVFTNSVETAHRLCRLVQLFGGLQGRVLEFSANLTATQRSAVLSAVSAGAISVMVTSDAAARGLDLPSLPAVINYDAPPRIKTYVHRAGRTARAGKLGLCYTLLTPDAARHFRLLMKRITSAAGEAGEGAPPVPTLKETLLDATIGAYAPRMTQVLAKLKSVLEEEASGALLPTKPLSALGAAAAAATVAASVAVDS